MYIIYFFPHVFHKIAEYVFKYPLSGLSSNPVPIGSDNLDYIDNYEELFGSNIAIHETWSETALFSKNLTFHKILTLRWIFSKFNSKRHWTLISLWRTI